MPSKAESSFGYAGKARKKHEQAERLSMKKAIATGKVDLDMADAADLSQEANQI